MATDELDLKPCDKKVFKKGAHVFTTHSIPPDEIEKWVRQVATRSGQRVDWHYFGGRAVVKALGDISKVEQAIQDLMPEHDRLFNKAMGKYR